MFVPGLQSCQTLWWSWRWRLLFPSAKVAEGRLCLTFDLFGLLRGPRKHACSSMRSLPPNCSSAVWLQRRPERDPGCQVAGNFLLRPLVHVICPCKLLLPNKTLVCNFFGVIFRCDLRVPNLSHNDFAGALIDLQQHLTKPTTGRSCAD